jgi:hypothetical protein
LDHWKEPSPTHPGETLQPGPFVKHVVSELFVGVSVEPLSNFCVVTPRVESSEEQPESVGPSDFLIHT